MIRRVNQQETISDSSYQQPIFYVPSIIVVSVSHIFKIYEVLKKIYPKSVAYEVLFSVKASKLGSVDAY